MTEPVAERLGFDRATALTLGQAVAGLSAYAKGVSLGIVETRIGVPLAISFTLNSASRLSSGPSLAQAVEAETAGRPPSTP
ncbi:MAG: hypothetical protein ACJ8H8_03335 [Geminicoccaceae bacterium]